MGLICRKTAIAGKSKEMKRIYSIIEKIAPMDVNVLISGESGCGKATMARMIHELSGRQGTVSVLDPCSAREDCSDKELEDIINSAFQSCNGGTMIINDIAEASQRVQNRLAATLNAEECIENLCYKVRVVACTGRNITELARQNRFRQDLCDILGVVSVELPPLRHRKEDIQDLADIFLKGYGEGGHESKTLSKDALSVLVKYDWPGNVRELENVLIQSAASAEGEEIGPSHIPSKVKRKNATAPKATMRDELYKLARGLIESGSHLEKADPFSEYMKIVEIPLLKAAMDMCGGNKSLAAKCIKINRNTLSKKLQEYDIE